MDQEGDAHKVRTGIHIRLLTCGHSEQKDVHGKYRFELRCSKPTVIVPQGHGSDCGGAPLFGRVAA